MDIDTALGFAAEHRRSILVTLRRDGRPQSSNVLHAPDGGELLVSVTDDRAKTRNARRDPRVSLHVGSDDFWSYVVIDGDADLTPPAQAPDDETVEALVAYYRASNGEHPDWAEYRAAMVREQRLILRVRPTHAYGSLPSGG